MVMIPSISSDPSSHVVLFMIFTNAKEAKSFTKIYTPFFKSSCETEK